jgi:hypothetical protein
MYDANLLKTIQVNKRVQLHSAQSTGTEQSRTATRKVVLKYYFSIFIALFI